MDKKAQRLGQIFTPRFIVDFMVRLSAIPKDGIVLDPCAGKGVFRESLIASGYTKIDGYEIDRSLPIVKNVFYKSFIGEKIMKSYDLIIGNPPYIRWKNLDTSLKKELQKNLLWQMYCNNLCDYLYIFILKAVEVLHDNGELIFITPEYWLTTKHAVKLREYMLENGYFTHIFHFNETPIFTEVSSSIIIFRYVKSVDRGERKTPITVCKYNERKKIDTHILEQIKTGKLGRHFIIPQFEKNKKWILADDTSNFELLSYEKACHGKILSDIAEIGNGMVSGLDDAFRINEETKFTKKEKEKIIPVVKAKQLQQFFFEKKTRYFLLNDCISEKELRENYPNFFKELSQFKKILEKRYNYNRMIPYWHWVFLRNHRLFSEKKKKIFIPCKERISHKSYFRFAIVSETVFPTQDVTGIVLKENIRESIYYLAALLNSRQVFQWITHNGVLRGNIVEFSEAPLNRIPVRLINWEDKSEKVLHNAIVEKVELFIKTRDEQIKNEIQKMIDTLLSM